MDSRVEKTRKLLLKSVGKFLLDIADYEPETMMQLADKHNVPRAYRDTLTRCGIIKKVDGVWKVKSQKSIDDIVEEIIESKSKYIKSLKNNVQKEIVSVDSTVEWLKKHSFENCTTNIDELKERVSKYDQLSGSLSMIAQTSSAVIRATKDIEPQIDEIKNGLSAVKAAIFDIQVAVKDNTAAITKLLTALIEKESLK